MFCRFCKGEIPLNRYSIRHLKPLYCSIQCIKRFYYLKNHKGSSIFKPETYNQYYQKGTGKGLKFEELAHKLLFNSIWKKFEGGADLIWNNQKVDVKVCELYRNWWTFNRNKIKQIDYFLCFALVKNEIERIYFIPNSVFKKIGITIGQKSKYDKFRLL